MHAMRYEVTLPSDYDMEIIRRRVASKGPATDAFPGLGFKAYAIRERGVDGSAVNQYAPFYLWADAAGMDQFLFHGPFEGFTADFGRPPVRHGRGLAFGRGPDHAGTPVVATRQTRSLAPEASIAGTVAAAVAEAATLARSPGLHCTTVALDPHAWELVTFSLWTEADQAGAGDRFRVLHLSRPHLDDLPSAQA